MDEITVSAKTLDDAITEALIQLGVTSDQLEYDIIEKGSAGFLGIGMKQAVIKARRKPEKEKEEELGIELVSLEDLLKNADFISMHCNLTEENKHMINAETFKMVKKGAVLINCARGALVDDQAVADAVKERTLFGYGADVCSQEPIHADNPLLHQDHIVLTPHVSVYNLTCTRNMNRKVMEDIYLVAEGKKPNVIVNGL